MKIIFLILLFSLVTRLSFADLYVVLDEHGQPNGTAQVKDEYLSKWKQEYTMIKVDESYVGKHGYEIKYENNRIRHATKSEKEAYKQAQEDKNKQREIDMWLSKLDNAEIKAKIKDIKNNP